MEKYEHGVFFEAENLSDTELKHIHKYFQIKRRSGGGDCEILKVDANNYKICFREKEGKLIIVYLHFFIFSLTKSRFMLVKTTI